MTQLRGRRAIVFRRERCAFSGDPGLEFKKTYEEQCSVRPYRKWMRTFWALYVNQFGRNIAVIVHTTLAIL
jgi:hypothetical protein